MRLSPAILNLLPPDVARFDYDRDEQKVGIVHFGLGAFHRAHQAWYTDLAMSGGERDWAIAGASLRSDAVARRLDPQGGLYTLTERGAAGEATRVVGALREAIVADRSPERLAIALTAPSTRIVSFTVTEKGYARRPDGSLDLELAGRSFYPHLAECLRQRMRRNLPGLTLLSCDNLPRNGEVLARLLAEWLAAHAPDTVRWFDGECACPNSMVDRIVPAATEADLAALEGRLGVRDEGAVFTEPFSQWIIENRFAGPRPGWDRHGARLVGDVAPYETAKLRMLNGAHSAMAYLGLERGHGFVDQAIADEELRALVERLMLEEAATSFVPAEGQDLRRYAADLIARFANPALEHRLAQIAADGSEKIPQRWLETLRAHDARGERCPALLEALASWMRYVRGDRGAVDDPMAAHLAELWRTAGRSGIAAALFGPGGLFADSWRAGEATLAELTRKLA
ncbi:mannitol dehydrogenase family protein [Croceibacterium aestuarii]|uniref:mannitol dehydrogenase family protein n=1 Tax=Croceibacterium aestuarii TaxID=3064139 RepID=UPI00272E798A|nr:mannitol dehydrogenase family protein [Croceibacterium sp. D39]